MALLRAENERLREALAAFPVRPLHGDAHPGNLLATPSGPMWNDFEDAFLGPLGWDLACLALTGRLDGTAALAAYPGEYSAEEVAVCVELRKLFGVVWRFVLARHFPARQADAEDNLREWLAARAARDTFATSPAARQRNRDSASTAATTSATPTGGMP